MIYGIGTDIVSIPRIAAGLARHGERFAQRILAADELAAFREHHPSVQAAFLAKRFAAKEAAAKALGVGFRDGLSLRHLVVSHDRLGKPLLEFRARGWELCQELGVGEAFLSLSDERELALAFVTLQRRLD